MLTIKCRGEQKYEKIFQDLNQEYLETRSSVGEDRLEWLIQRKMTWGMRWGLVLVFMFVVQPITYNPFFLLGCFYLGSFLGLVYILGQVFFATRSIFRNWKKNNRSACLGWAIGFERE